MPQTLLGAWLLLAVPCSGGALGGCGKGGTPDVKALQGKWVLESIDGRAVEAETGIYFKIDGTTISGFDGCNTFGGSIDAPEEMRMTQRACPPDTLRLPLDLSNPRPQLESSKLEGDTLEMDLADEEGKARFRREKAG